MINSSKVRKLYEHTAILKSLIDKWLETSLAECCHLQGLSACALCL